MEKFTAYLAAPGFVHDLVTELGEDTILDVLDHLVLASGPPRPAAWAQNTWLDPRWIDIESIGDAAAKLKAIQRNWACYPFDFHRRTALIEEKLPHISAKPLTFPCLPPSSALGSWTLVDEKTMLASPASSSAFPNGLVHFVENKDIPPNRAYLKLWEALTLAGKWPGAGDTCLDLGSSPGGWTWVLQTLGARVISLDKAPLDPKIAGLPNIDYRQGSAFALTPQEFGKIDWLFSDVICYPERLLRLVNSWIEAGTAKHIICTLKFQAETDHASAKAFQAIPNSRLIHLSHNKHELTWFWGI